jgi:bifunctional non-homologous end joining protein LigD
MLVREPFHRDGSVYEEKVDGWRIVASNDGERVRLVSRNGVDHTRRFRDIAAQSRSCRGTLVLDSEVAIYDQQLRSRFRVVARFPTPTRSPRRRSTWRSTCSTATAAP